MRAELIAPSLLALALGLHWAWIAWPLLVHGSRSRHWPTAPGVITGGYIADADGHPRLRSYSAGVTYEYAVQGTVYQRSLISYRYAFAFASVRAVVRAKAPYPPGSGVAVYYDPEHPERAVLEPGVGVQNYVAAALPCAPLLIGALLLYGALLA